MQTATLMGYGGLSHTYRLSLRSPALVGWAYVSSQTLNIFFVLTAPADAVSLSKHAYSI
jgi:hypothetical protein